MTSPNRRAVILAAGVCVSDDRSELRLPQAFVMGLMGLAAYKHVSWLKLVADTVNHPPAMNEDRPSHVAALRS